MHRGRWWWVKHLHRRRWSRYGTRRWWGGHVHHWWLRHVMHRLGSNGVVNMMVMMLEVAMVMVAAMGVDMVLMASIIR